MHLLHSCLAGAGAWASGPFFFHNGNCAFETVLQMRDCGEVLSQLLVFKCVCA